MRFVSPFLLLSLTTLAADWPQWRGPNRDGISAETGLAASWPAAGPPVVWKVKGLGQGYSSLAISKGRRARIQLVLDAADRITSASVNAVALDLGVSERHLRRVFLETVGVGPKKFAQLTRFRRAVHAAREEGHASWARIAADAGYYDQAHLITEFRAIAVSSCVNAVIEQNQIINCWIGGPYQSPLDDSVTDPASPPTLVREEHLDPLNALNTRSLIVRGNWYKGVAVGPCWNRRTS